MRKFQIKEKLNHITILHHVEPDGTIWGTSGRKIYHKKNKAWALISTFPFAAPRDYFGFSRWTARAARADKCNIYVNTHGAIIGIRAGKVYAIHPHQPPKELFEINGDSVLHGSICEDDKGWTYFGEYFMNPERDPVNIWRVSPNLKQWEAAHQFPASSIRHVHGIYQDPFKPGSFWIPTGDFENECYFFHTNDRFKSINKIGEGSQIWRAVRLFFTKDHICWLTDSNLEQNYACRMDRKTLSLEIGHEIDASAWYGAMTAEGNYFAFTTVEPGPGIKTKNSQILFSHDGFSWEVIKEHKKDFLRPMKIFKYGVISCPSGKMSEKDFYISGEGLVGLDGRSLKFGFYS